MTQYPPIPISDMTSAGQVLSEVEPYAFNMAEKVQPQVEEMTRNVVQIFEDVLHLLSGVILSKGVGIPFLFLSCLCSRKENG
jgi:hypothetical protein